MTELFTVRQELTNSLGSGYMSLTLLEDSGRYVVRSDTKFCEECPFNSKLIAAPNRAAADRKGPWDWDGLDELSNAGANITEAVSPNHAQLWAKFRDSAKGLVASTVTGDQAYLKWYRETYKGRGFTPELITHDYPGDAFFMARWESLEAHFTYHPPSCRAHDLLKHGGFCCGEMA